MTCLSKHPILPRGHRRIGTPDPPLKIMFVLEHKEEERNITNVTNNLRYDLLESMFISPSKSSLKSFHQDQLLRTELSKQT